jgi:hypothetical protein
MKSARTFHALTLIFPFTRQKVSILWQPKMASVLGVATGKGLNCKFQLPLSSSGVVPVCRSSPTPTT